MRILLILAALGCAHAPQNPTCPAACVTKPLFAEEKKPDAVDGEVLAMCPAPPKGLVEHDAVRDFFARHVEDARLSAVLPKVLVGKERQEWLAQIWSGPSQRNAFTHVLCGDDWERDALGGLHLESRYRQLEREGKLCYDGSARTFGDACSGGQCQLRYRTVKAISCGVKETGGFLQDFDALDLLAAGTRAYLTCCLNHNGQIIRESARYKGPRSTTFQIACGDRNGAPGIITFYPIDDTPDCGP